MIEMAALMSQLVISGFKEQVVETAGQGQWNRINKTAICCYSGRTIQ
jgi:hypothetical protein